MGKIKNDFQFWMGNNHRGVLRGGNRINLSLSELGGIVEQYIQATANRLKQLKDEDKGGLVIPTNGPDPFADLDEKYKSELTSISEEDLNKIKRALGL